MKLLPNGNLLVGDYEKGLAEVDMDNNLIKQWIDKGTITGIQR